MGSPVRNPETVHFADYILDLETAELRRNGTRIVLQDQPFQILTTLIESQGRLVTREELIKKLWPSGTFVDFEQSLTRAVGRLRETLGDTAEQPQFIETFPRKGYRFIAPITSRTKAAESAAIPMVGAGARSEMERVAERSKHRHRSLTAALASLFLLAAGLVLVISILGRRTKSSTGTTSQPAIQSLAVLPLENLSADPSQDYFADGMTDQLITDLGQISTLRVISRTSAMQYRGIHKPLPQIARALNVDAIVEGTVLRSGDQVRITAQLIEANGDKQLWAQSYQRDLANVLELQKEIANTIATQVKMKLAPGEHLRLGVERPVNTKAYESYLRGEYYLNRFTPDSLTKATDYFRQAIVKDSSYAPAYTKLAGTYLMLGNMDVMPKKESHHNATALIDTALRLDPSFAAAHAVRGWSLLQYDLDFTRAGVEFKRAVELNPNNVEARQGLGEYYLTLGQLQQAVQEMEKARELDPLASIVNAALCKTFTLARRYDEALAQCQANLDLDPAAVGAIADLGKLYVANGMDAKAVSTFMRFFEKCGYSRARLDALQIGATKSGVKGLFQAWLRQERPDLNNSAENPMITAEVYIYAQDDGAAIIWLEKAVKTRSFGITLLGVDPIFDKLRSDPHFMSILTRMGLTRFDS